MTHWLGKLKQIKKLSILSQLHGSSFEEVSNKVFCLLNNTDGVNTPQTIIAKTNIEENPYCAHISFFPALNEEWEEFALKSYLQQKAKLQKN